MSFWIVTDACTDFPESYIKKQKDIKVLPFSYQIDGKVYIPDGSERDAKKFYSQLRDGKIATTFQVNTEAWKEALRPLIAKGQEVLCLVFSSGLSGTYQAAVNAKEEIDEEFPNGKLVVIDTLCASLGQGLLVHYALEMRDKGFSMEETIKWVKENIKHLAHWFTVDDLQFLRRGGRVSATSAYLGSMLKIKPVLHVDHEGKLIPMEKVQGRKRSLKALMKKAEEIGTNIKDQVIFISHGDCEEEAQWLADKIMEELHPKEIMLSMIGPIIGSHSGPGTVALFFLGKDR